MLWNYESAIFSVVSLCNFVTEFIYIELSVRLYNIWQIIFLVSKQYERRSTDLLYSRTSSNIIWNWKCIYLQNRHGLYVFLKTRCLRSNLILFFCFGLFCCIDNVWRFSGPQKRWLHTRKRYAQEWIQRKCVTTSAKMILMRWNVSNWQSILKTYPTVRA